MNKKTTLLLALLVVVPGCGPKKKVTSKEYKDDTMTQVDIPVAGDNVKSFFDEDLGEFAMADGAGSPLSSQSTINEYAWVEDENQSGDFKVVYFDFDKYKIKSTQEENVNYDVQAVKKAINDQLASGAAHPEVKILVEGHACHSAGSAIYNLALSEKRAKVMADRLIAAGVSPEYVKIVGRGQEVPAVVNGKVVSGSREQQWPNRRAEVRILA